MLPLIVASRFRGPAGSANGGYVCGRVAGYLDGQVTVTLLRPPPLDTPLTVGSAAGTVDVRHGDTPIAHATSTKDTLPVHVPGVVSIAEAGTAEGRAAYFRNPLYPECFVCGPGRLPGDGLRVFPGPVPGRALWAAPWTPDTSLADGGRSVAPEIVWAALDCPGGIAAVEAADIGPDLAVLLGRMTATLRDRPVVGERYRVVGWPIARQDRRLTAGSALLGPDDHVLAVARTVWVTVRRAARELAADGAR